MLALCCLPRPVVYSGLVDECRRGAVLVLLVCSFIAAEVVGVVSGVGVCVLGTKRSKAADDSQERSMRRAWAGRFALRAQG
ncbi:hypothetical protein CBR_g27875 [Chara braunii]|uniref:Uncharacterized protein n=1 Tax=Chara braunii TaxID=69332 RepID=A0A388L8K5_CHABU|nr:hypothetical protein CBR_g27875 [Chara braunii]|eukprot:GBG78649.1 hypothetical protein CBR_g27875 [Chara braunii]